MTEGVVEVLLTNVVVFGLILAAFYSMWVVPRKSEKRAVSQPLLSPTGTGDDVEDDYSSEDVDRSRDNSSFWSFLDTPDEKILLNSGMDALLYLKFELLLLKLIVIGGLLALAVVLPVHVTSASQWGCRTEQQDSSDASEDVNDSDIMAVGGGQSRYVECTGFEATTARVIRNVDYFWVHVVVTFVISALFLKQFSNFSLEWERLVVRHHHRSELTARTVHVQGLPPTITDHTALERHFSAFYPAEVVAAVIVEEGRAKLRKLKIDRDEAQLKRDLYQQIEASSASPPGSGRRPTVRIVSKLCKKFDAISFYEQRVQQLTDEINTGEQRPKQGTGHAFVLFCSIATASRCIADQKAFLPIRPAIHVLARSPSAIVRSPSRADPSDVNVSVDDDETWDDEEVGFLTPQSNRYPHPSVLVGAADPVAESPPPSSGSGGVVVKVAAQDEINNPHIINGYDTWRIEPAPESDDILWEHLEVSQTYLVASRVTVNLGILLLFLLSTPSVVFSSLQDLKGVSDFFNWAASLPSPVGPWLFAYLPTLSLLLINILLLCLIEVACEMNKHMTKSRKEKDILVKSFVYLLVNTLIIPGLALVTLEALIQSTRHESVLNILGNMFIAGSGSLFCNYLTQAGILGSSFYLLRVPDIFYTRMKKMETWAVSVSSHTYHMETHKPLPFQYGYFYATLLSSLAITVCFSTMMPIIMPFGVIFFGVRYMVDKYNLTMVHVVDLQSDGMLASSAVKVACFCVLLYEFAMASFLSIKRQTVMATFVLALFAFSCLYVYRIFERHDMVLGRETSGLLPLSGVTTSSHHDEDHTKERFRSHYRPTST